jgi:hypothetical protein
MVYNTQNNWVYRLSPSPCILTTRKLDISETICFCFRVRRRKFILCWSSKSSFRNVVFSGYLESRTVQEFHKPSDSEFYNKVFGAELMGVSLLLFLKYHPKRSS